jgi:hypothetical protein
MAIFNSKLLNYQRVTSKIYNMNQRELSRWPMLFADAHSDGAGLQAPMGARGARSAIMLRLS